MKKAYCGICLNRKAECQNDESLQNPTGPYPQVEEKSKMKIKVTYKDTEGKEAKKEMPVISDCDTLKLLLNNI